MLFTCIPCNYCSIFFGCIDQGIVNTETLGCFIGRVYLFLVLTRNGCVSDNTSQMRWPTMELIVGMLRLNAPMAGLNVLVLQTD